MTEWKTTHAERLAYGTMGADWQDRINWERLRRERSSRGFEIIKKHGYGAFILALGDNQRYMTHLHPGVIASLLAGGSGFSIVFPENREDSVSWMTEGNIVKQSRFHCPWLKPENIRAVHSMTVNQGQAAVDEMCKLNATEIVQVLKEHRLDKEKIGMDAPIAGIMPYLKNAGIQVEIAPHVMTEAREVKTPDEIKIMQMVGCIADIAWGALADIMRPGLTENQYGAAMAAALQGAGAHETFVVSLRTGPNTAPNYLSHSPVDRVVEAGDILTCDLIGPIYMGYRVCYYRTFAIGLPPKQVVKDAYKEIRDWLYAAADLLKPGASTADIVQVWPKCVEWGYNSEDECWTNALGHGIGLGQYEVPSLRRATSIKFPQEIKKGQVIALETWKGLDRHWGVRIENVFVVTDKGAENLYMWPDEEITCPWKQRIW
jgi:Xaa-Pro aminopeptidase